MSRSILLDTHFVIWPRSEPQILTAKERGILDAAPVRYVSAATFWEMGILIGLGRIPHDDRLFGVAPGIEMLPVEPLHCRELGLLPQHHRDPFDRMLIAQARTGGLVLMTRDEKILAYGGDGATCADLR